MTLMAIKVLNGLCGSSVFFLVALRVCCFRGTSSPREVTEAFCALIEPSDL